MLNFDETETMWSLARNVCKSYPVSYTSFVGYERLAVLPILEEPIKSTLHSILQLNVAPGTKCIFKKCDGILDKKGKCCNKCEQSGINVVKDIMECLNCDTYGFPCPTCKDIIFHNQLKAYIDY